MKFSLRALKLILPALCVVTQVAWAGGAMMPNYTPNTGPSSQLPPRQANLSSINDKIPQFTTQDASAQYKQILSKMQSMQKSRQAVMNNSASAPAQNGLGSSSFSTTSPRKNNVKAQSPVTKKVSSNNLAFIKMLNNMNPLTPEQIKMMHAMYNKTQQATNYPDDAQTPSISSITVSLQPNATPPVISLAPGIVTSLVFLDSTGQPWPIQFTDIGNSKDYDAKQTVQASKGKLGSNTLLLQSLNENAKPGNIAIMLQGSSTPVMLALSTNQKVINYRVDLHIPGSGPNATINTGSALAPMNNGAVMTALNGTAPAGAKVIQLNGCSNCQAWRSGKYIYLRTKRRLLSPSWVSQSQSADGTHAYKVQLSPVLLTYLNGKIARINVSY